MEVVGGGAGEAVGGERGDSASMKWKNAPSRKKSERRNRGFRLLLMPRFTDWMTTLAMIPFSRSFLLSISLHALLAVLAGAEEPTVVARFREPPPESRNEPGFITLHPAGGRVYLVVRAASGADRNVLFLTDPATRQGKTLPLAPPHAAGGEMLVTEEAAYLYQTADEDRQLAAVARLDRATGQVKRKAVPPFSYLGNAVIGDDLYLNLWTGKWSGLMRFNWPTGVATVLADSRRKPRRNQFDDCEDYGTMLLLAGPGGRPVAVVRGQPFFVREEAGDWPPVFAPGESPDAVQFMRPGFWRTAVASRGVLLYSLRGDLVWLDPREKQTVPLIVSEPTAALFPDWKKEARWDEFSFEEMLKSVVVASDRGVFSLHRRPVERGSGYYLRWYRAGRRTAVEMPLEFGKPAKIEGAKGVVADQEKAFDVSGTSAFSKPKMTVGEQGLLFSNSFRGFWFLPFTELGAEREGAR